MNAMAEPGSVLLLVSLCLFESFASTENVNDLIHISFSPPQLSVFQGEMAEGLINVTVHGTNSTGGIACLQARAKDGDFGSLVESLGDFCFDLHGYHFWDVLNVTYEARHIGRTTIEFFLTSNYSSIDDVDGDVIDSVSNGSVTSNVGNFTATDTNLNDTVWAGWKSLISYDVVITRHLHPSEQWLDYSVIFLIVLNLLGVGGQVQDDRALKMITRPKAVCVALFCRFGVMPALGLGFVEFMRPDHHTAVGVLGFLCSPLEGAGSLLNLLAEKDLTLSAMLMCITNFATVALFLLWAIAFETQLYDEPGAARIPFKEMSIVFGYTFVGLLSGFAIRRKSQRVYHKMWTHIPSLTVVTVVLILALQLYKSPFVFQLLTAKYFALSAILAAAGYAVGGLVALVFRLPSSQIAVVALETGCRTTYVTTLLLRMSYEMPESDIACTVPVLGSTMSLLSAFVGVLVYRTYHRLKEQDYIRTKFLAKDRRKSDHGIVADLDSDDGKIALRETKL